MNNAFTAPASFIRNVRNRAPLKTISENWGRSIGYYGDADESTRIYRAILVYIEQGMGKASPLFEGVRAFIEKVQPRSMHYIVLPMSFGDDEALHHDGKAIRVTSGLNRLTGRKFLETCVSVAGDEPAERPYIPVLFPKTDYRSLYQGKVAVDRNDLLIFLNNDSSLQFSEKAGSAARRYRKQAVVVDYREGDSATWSFLPQDIRMVDF